ncbi:LysR family hca operon transcriptional activator [Nitrobacteraceae bacterium AZCC 2161]
MELRHLRYFIAVAEEKSFTAAAEKRLHTTQPSLSRQIRELEVELGVDLLVRGSSGLELTPAGHTFKFHVQLALAQIEAAGEAARRALRAADASFTIGFLTGYEVEWLPVVLAILREEMPNVEITVRSQSSPELIGALLRGKVDIAFVRGDEDASNLGFRFLTKEPLIVILPKGHPLADRDSIAIQDLANETFIGVAESAAPVLRSVIDNYTARANLTLSSGHDADNLPMAISLVISTPGVSLQPPYVRQLLPPAVVSRPLSGDVPTIDLSIGYNKTNRSPILALFLSKIDGLIERVSKQAR